MSYVGALLYPAASIILLVLVVFILSHCFAPLPVSFKGKHVLIVGGSSGIGLSMAELFLKEGAKVSILARSLTKLNAAKAKLDDAEGNLGVLSRVRVYSADASSQAAVNNAVSELTDLWGPVNVLICSQGVSHPMKFEHLSDKLLHEVMDANYWGCVYPIRAVLPGMKSSGTGGRIALVSSQAGQVGVYGLSHYSATKFALRGLAEGLQQEFAPYNIRLSLIFPPDTDTPLLAEENKTKHPVTKILTEGQAPMNPLRVARIGLEGIRAGMFSVPCGFEGTALALSTAGMSPQPSMVWGILEVISISILRIVALGTLAGWYSSILNWHKVNKEVEEKEE